MTDYKPALNQIIDEMVRHAKEEIKTFRVNFGRNYLRALTYTLLYPHVSPTVNRLRKEADLSRGTYTRIGKGAGITTGTIGLAGQGGLYAIAWNAGYPEAALVPVVTNICSLIYESGRNAKQRLQKQHERFMREARDWEAGIGVYKL